MRTNAEDLVGRFDLREKFVKCYRRRTITREDFLVLHVKLPFAQPRALIFGHFLSALVGLCVTRLFELLPESRFHELRWLAASLSSAIAVVDMQITDTTHPPAGVIALLPVMNGEIRALSW